MGVREAAAADGVAVAAGIVRSTAASASSSGDWPGGDPWAALAAAETVESEQYRSGVVLAFPGAWRTPAFTVPALVEVKGGNVTAGDDEHPVGLGEGRALLVRAESADKRKGTRS